MIGAIYHSINLLTIAIDLVSCFTLKDMPKSTHTHTNFECCIVLKTATKTPTYPLQKKRGCQRRIIQNGSFYGKNKKFHLTKLRQNRGLFDIILWLLFIYKKKSGRRHHRKAYTTQKRTLTKLWNKNMVWKKDFDITVIRRSLCLPLSIESRERQCELNRLESIIIQSLYETK